jgi:hypothetical protein
MALALDKLKLHPMRRLAAIVVVFITFAPFGTAQSLLPPSDAVAAAAFNPSRGSVTSYRHGHSDATGDCHFVLKSGTTYSYALG